MVISVYVTGLPGCSCLCSLLRYFVNCVTQDGLTALHLATFSGHVEIVMLLLKNKADVDICDVVNFYISNCLN